MIHGSLFSGIGGFDLAAQWAGIETVWQVENDPFCQKVLRKHFPEAKRYGDIKTIKSGDLEPVDIISGGFPCQPFSCAGKRGGTKDDRFLWPEMLRIISEVRPTWVIAENVPGIINMELDQVLADLESQDYEVQTFIIPACAVNAPHRRDRVWICAHSLNGTDRTERRTIREANEIQGINRPSLGSGLLTGTDCHAADANGNGAQWDQPEYGAGRRIAQNDSHAADTNGAGLPIHLCGQFGSVSSQTESSQGRESCGAIPAREQWDEPWLEAATRLCRVDNGVRNRVDRLKAIGNAIVPQVAFQFFKMIKKIEEHYDRYQVNV